MMIETSRAPALKAISSYRVKSVGSATFKSRSSKATGGTAPYTYSLKASTGDNAEFKISGTEVQAAAQIATAGTKNITVIVTDSKQKTKEATAQIEIAEAGV